MSIWEGPAFLCRKAEELTRFRSLNLARKTIYLTLNPYLPSVDAEVPCARRLAVPGEPSEQYQAIDLSSIPMLDQPLTMTLWHSKSVIVILDWQARKSSFHARTKTSSCLMQFNSPKFIIRSHT